MFTAGEKPWAIPRLPAHPLQASCSFQASPSLAGELKTYSAAEADPQVAEDSPCAVVAVGKTLVSALA